MQSIRPQKLRILILIKTAPATKLLSWQQCHRCHFTSFLMFISGAKFEGYCSNVSRDIHDSVFYHFNYRVYNVIIFLICIIQKHNISRKKKDIPKFFCKLLSLSNKQQLFFI